MPSMEMEMEFKLKYFMSATKKNRVFNTECKLGKAKPTNSHLEIVPCWCIGRSQNIPRHHDVESSLKDRGTLFSGLTFTLRAFGAFIHRDEVHLSRDKNEGRFGDI